MTSDARDARIGDDLAVVARTSRARPRALAATLRAIGASPARSEHGATTRAALAVGPIYAARLARIAAGVTLWLLICLYTVLLAYVRVPEGDFDARTGTAGILLDVTPRDLAVGMLTIACLVYAGVWAMATRTGDRRSRADVDRLERPALVVGIAAPVVFVVFFQVLAEVVPTWSSLLDFVSVRIDSYGVDEFSILYWFRQRVPDTMLHHMTAYLTVGACALTPMVAIFASEWRIARLWAVSLIAVPWLYIGSKLIDDEIWRPSDLHPPTLLLPMAAFAIGIAGSIVLFLRDREVAALDGK